MERRHCIYLGCGCSSGQRRNWDCYRMLPYYTRGGPRWVSGVQYGDQGAMKAKGKARLEPPRNPGYASTGYCMRGWQWITWGQGWWTSPRWRKYADNEGPALASPHVCCFVPGCCVAPIGDILAFRLLLCCCVALPCPFTPGEQTGQRPSPLLMVKPCSCHCPQSLVGRYPRSSGSSVMLWATSGSPGTHGIEQGRNHLSVRDARKLQ